MTEPSAAAFDSLGLDLRLLKAVRKVGLEKPTPVQACCIPLALAGKDVLAKAPTGSGKTYAYMLPLLQKVLARQDAAPGPTESPGALVLVPTRELCQQVHAVARGLLGGAGAGSVRLAQLAGAADGAAVRAGRPADVLVATPAQLLAHLAAGAAPDALDRVHTLVIDEADLLLSYGYGDDMAAVGRLLPRSVHTMLLSATLTPDLDAISSLFLHNPATVDCSADDTGGGGPSGLRQFWLRCSHPDKFLLMYALLKLNRIPGRSLVFVNAVDRGFRLKLFLEQFGVSAGVLNCELPLESRWHAIQAFNKGLFDILIATDDPKLMSARAAAAHADTSALASNPDPAETPAAEAPISGSKRKRRAAAAGDGTSGVTDAEFGVSRGVDFCDVTAVINMDMPRGQATYKHRVGRTARAGQGGTAISMVDENDVIDNQLLEELNGEYGDSLRQFSVDFTKLSAFRYRVDDAMRAVTRHAVREARLKEIKQELLHSKRLAEHFDANPRDLDALRHDKPLATVRKQPHLHNVPSYLKPDTEGATAPVAPVASRRRPARDGGKRGGFGGKGAKRRKDPLQTFKGGRKAGGAAKGRAAKR